MKYEWDEKTNMLKLDRVLHGAAFYPHDYGFIPQTLCGDGDPLVRTSCNEIFDNHVHNAQIAPNHHPSSRSSLIQSKGLEAQVRARDVLLLCCICGRKPRTGS